MHYTELVSDCAKCGLLDTCKGPVPDDGGDYIILVCGEAPGIDENEGRRPFIGRSGRLLRTALINLGYPEDLTTYTNIVRCMPPNNELKQKYIRCCYKSLPIKDNTKLVILLGNTPLKAVLGETGITNWNGIIVERDGIVYAPCFHPAYILRNDNAMDIWVDALDKALDRYTNGSKPSVECEVLYPVSTVEIHQMCRDIVKSPIISFDIETATLDPYSKDARLLAMSFCNGKKAWAVVIDHPEDLAPISDESLYAICMALENHPYVIGHNIKFDQMHMKVLLDSDFKAKGDTMLLSFLIDSQRGIHGLKRLAGYYLGMFEYAKELDDYKAEHKEADYERGGNYSNVPMDILLPYAAKDAIATYKLHPILYTMLTDKQKYLYDELMIPVSNALYKMQVNGMAVDHKVADRYYRIYHLALNDVIARIYNDQQVKLYEKRRRQASKKFTFNPGSWMQRAVVLYGTSKCNFLKKGAYEHYEGKYYNLKPLKRTKKDAPSTDRDAIEKYRAVCPLVDDLVMYSMLDKMLGTYIEPVALGTKLSGDGRARSSFNQHVVETGRISSSSFSNDLGFNQQNIPVPEKEPGTILQYQPIKNMFTHTFGGGCLLSADYSGMELRVFASLAECEAMIEIHKSGQDFHTMVGAMVSGKPYEEITKEERYRYKWTNWTLLYGGGASTLERMYGIPIKDAEEVIRKYHQRFPEVKKYMKRCEDFARKNGYIETPFGNRRPLPDIRATDSSRAAKAAREAVNTPIQGAAGMVTLAALVIIDRIMQEGQFKSMLVNTVHDSILVDVYPGELDDLAILFKSVMENIKKYAKKYMPNIDFDWLICPLLADIESGTHYGSLEKYEEDK
jgi:DNA polymerase-1